jgi:hypothetical protein
MLKKIIQAAVIIAILTGPAAAQVPLNFPTGASRPLTPEEIERQNAIDNAYKSATKKIPDKKPVADPWGDVRPNPATAKNKQ